MDRLARADDRDRPGGPRGEGLQHGQADVADLDALPPPGVRGDEVRVEPLQPGEASLVDLVLDHREQVDVAPALDEAAGREGAEEVKAEQALPELVPQELRELGDPLARLAHRIAARNAPASARSSASSCCPAPSKSAYGNGQPGRGSSA